MSLAIALRHAFSLAKTLMVCVVLIHTEGGYGVMLACEFDGPAEVIVHEYDPFG